MFILSTVVLTSEAKSALSPSELQAHLVNEASSVQIPYIVLTVALVLLAVVILMCKLPKLPKLTSDKLEADTLLQGKLTQHKHLMFGVIGIFMYVGAEVSIGSFLINFMENPAIANLSALEASKHLALYWGGAMIGRFVGSYVMTWIRPNKLLAFNAIIISLIIVAMMI
ncbi:hypothetical protein L9X50_13595 [Vibrio aestuarianus]|uniref:hypothetical protein n=1 Tax=Vibrio aestuarianus TaxID=28171 RepID=UPI00237D219B|nr:hypothetical protein [Vibrio aestuarianus]MDE1319035.1 hypothetical protein [Vibrio aestuarianus]